MPPLALASVVVLIRRQMVNRLNGFPTMAWACASSSDSVMINFLRVVLVMLFAWWLKVFSLLGSSKYAHHKQNGFNLKPMHYVWFCRVKWRPMRSSRSSSSLKSQL
jgi:hypothetical protein